MAVAGDWTNQDDFRAAGTPFWQAWLTLHEGCDVPPSFELFMHELDLMRRGGRIVTPGQAAWAIVARYHRHAV